MEVTHQSTAPHPGKQLLFICFGNMSTRKIVQDLQYELNKRFKKYNISTDFEYLGTEQQASTEAVTAAAARHPHDIVLLFTPESVEDTTIGKRGVKIKPFKPIPWEMRTKIKTSTHQTTFLALFGDNELTTPFWTAGIEIWVDMSNQEIYETLSKELLFQWKEIKLIVKGS